MCTGAPGNKMYLQLQAGLLHRNYTHNHAPVYAMGITMAFSLYSQKLLLSYKESVQSMHDCWAPQQLHTT